MDCIVSGASPMEFVLNAMLGFDLIFLILGFAIWHLFATPFAPENS